MLATNGSAREQTQQRRDYAYHLFSRLEWATAAPHILTVGTGAADIADYLEMYSFSRLQIDYFDPTSTARKGRQRQAGQSLPSATYHLIWAPDLCTALDGRARHHLLAQLQQTLLPGGKVVINVN